MLTSDERHQVEIAWFRHHLLKDILPPGAQRLLRRVCSLVISIMTGPPKPRGPVPSCRSPGGCTTSPKATR